MTAVGEVAAISAAILVYAVAAALALGLTRRPAGAMRPGERAARARWWLYAPVWAPVLLLWPFLFPGVYATVGGMTEHCLSHADRHHHHICRDPVPHADGHDGAVLLLTLLAIPFLVAAAGALRHTWREWHVARALVATSRALEPHDGVRCLPTDEPLAFTAGLVRPSILVSQGLVDRATPETLSAIIAHERAHVARNDSAWAVLDRLLGSLLPSVVRAPLLDELALAREQACDEVAARVTGKARVAAALLEVLRLRVPCSPIGVSAAGACIDARVRSLLEPPAARATWLLEPALSIALCVLAGYGPLPTLLECIASFLLH